MAKGRKTGGRRPGSTNRLTADVKSAIEQAFERVGGADYLVGIAGSDPAVFCSLVGKLVPKDIHKTLELGPQLADILRTIAARRRERDMGLVSGPIALRDGSVSGHA